MIKKVSTIAHGGILVSIKQIMISPWISQIHKFIRFKMSWRGTKKCKVKGSNTIMILKMLHVQSKQLSKFLQIKMVRELLLLKRIAKTKQWNLQLLIPINSIWISTLNRNKTSAQELLQSKFRHNHYRQFKFKRKLLRLNRIE